VYLLGRNLKSGTKRPSWQIVAGLVVPRAPQRSKARSFA
jgi:hypothetical protein